MTSKAHDATTDLAGRVRWIGLAAGPIVAGWLLLLLPDAYLDVEGATATLSGGGRATLAVMAWMAVWWLTEAISLEATALLPVVLFPLIGAGTFPEAAAPYSSELIFLFMGGFLLAFAMQRWGLDRRIALRTLRLAGTTPTRLIGGFMVATAAMSSCISNTATTAMMLPIGLGVIGLVSARSHGESTGGTEGISDEDGDERFAICLLLSIAYAASIGGMATIIGSPPNGFLVQYARDELGIEISFLDWMKIGLPVTALFLPIAWWLMTRWIYPVARTPVAGGRELIDSELRELGSMNRGERLTLAIFGLTVLLWMTRPLLSEAVPALSDGGIAIGAGVLLFALPVSIQRREFVMEWSVAKGLPFGILILFGGGLSLAAAVKRNGVAEFLGAQATALHGADPLWLLVALTAGMIFLTELTSNLATTATLVPVLAAMAPTLGLHPFVLIVPVTVAASCAFMLPIATPPNAIVFGSGRLTIPTMCRAGLWLNFVGIALISVVMHYFVLPLFVTS